MNNAETIEFLTGFLGTPYCENHNKKGIGCDCLGLIEAVLIHNNINPPPRGNHNLKSGFDEYLIPKSSIEIGDILLFQGVGINDFHCGILVNDEAFIHAHWGQGVVINSLGNWFKKRLIGIYVFKENHKWHQ